MIPLLPHFYRNRFWRFISNPDDEVSLKLFFDNFRNYTIAAALIFAGLVLNQPYASGWRLSAGLLLLAVGYVLSCFNMLQLFALSVRAVHTFLPFARWDLGGRFRPRLKMLVLTLLPLALSGSVLWFVYALVNQLLHR